MRQKICAMIPARIGSQRLKYKNLALINNKPMIYYAIKAAKKSQCFDKIFINSSPMYPVAPAMTAFNESFIF